MMPHFPWIINTLATNLVELLKTGTSECYLFATSHALDPNINLICLASDKKPGNWYRV
jgi:hypothetical protein